jgi:hypothetical protein
MAKATKMSDPIKEAKNPLAKKMKEIETQGRRAALETKLAAIDEMIEETQGRLTRIDEDNEFRDMMDKNAVKEVRKQLKELERAEAKLQKEYDKVSGGRKKETVVDETAFDGFGGDSTPEEKEKLALLDDPIEEDAIDNAVDEVELEEDDLRFEGLNGVHDLKPMVPMNESLLRMQKLAGLITEGEFRKNKLRLNENLQDIESILTKAGLYFDEGILGTVGSGGAGYYDRVNDEIYGFNQQGPWNEEAFSKFYDNFSKDDFAEFRYEKEFSRENEDTVNYDMVAQMVRPGIYSVGNEGYAQIHDNGDIQIFSIPSLSWI